MPTRRSTSITSPPRIQNISPGNVSQYGFHNSSSGNVPLSQLLQKLEELKQRNWSRLPEGPAKTLATIGVERASPTPLGMTKKVGDNVVNFLGKKKDKDLTDFHRRLMGSLKQNKKEIEERTKKWWIENSVSPPKPGVVYKTPSGNRVKILGKSPYMLKNDKYPRVPVEITDDTGTYTSNISSHWFEKFTELTGPKR